MSINHEGANGKPELLACLRGAAGCAQHKGTALCLVCCLLLCFVASCFLVASCSLLCFVVFCSGFVVCCWCCLSLVFVCL